MNFKKTTNLLQGGKCNIFQSVLEPKKQKKNENITREILIVF